MKSSDDPPMLSGMLHSGGFVGPTSEDDGCIEDCHLSPA